MESRKTNSLRNALGSMAATPHPDADLLTAFAEGSLQVEECGQVLDHLARCAACRAAVALTCETEPARQVAAASSRRPFFRIAFPALAAAAAVVITFVVVHRAPHNEQHEAAVATHGVAPRTADNGLDEPPVARGTARAKAVPSKRESTSAVAASPAAAVAAPSPAATPAAAPQPGPEGNLPKVAGAEPEPPADKAPPVLAAAEQVQVEPFAPGQASRRAEAKQGLQSARKPTIGAPSAFANSVTSEALGAASATPLARPHWRINRQGQPERAFGSGPWQTVLPADAPRMRVLATSGAGVWIGGDNAQLYHSTDNGETWAKIALPEKGNAPHTIAHIQMDSPTDITVQASDGTKWTTANGGASWK